ncbi:MAG TPA: SET domain-containing protein [Lacibacter sp.]|nr:SET domain-containing protein [Lacibacter sp.]HMO87633.1 SET domain-containing protein [Lacibacter sp.]HMP88360.1 SET domain-containing protein [Lacibacter sp.]
MRLPFLYIEQSPERGRGVFTAEAIPADTVVETAPVIVMSPEERVLLDQTLLHDYIFEWGFDNRGCAVALGWISLYNHSATANCEYFMDFEEESMFIKTVRPVEPGEELFVNYNGSFDNGDPVWFTPAAPGSD